MSAAEVLTGYKGLYSLAHPVQWARLWLGEKHLTLVKPLQLGTSLTRWTQKARDTLDAVSYSKSHRHAGQIEAPAKATDTLDAASHSISHRHTGQTA